MKTELETLDDIVQSMETFHEQTKNNCDYFMKQSKLGKKERDGRLNELENLVYLNLYLRIDVLSIMVEKLALVSMQQQEKISLMNSYFEKIPKGTEFDEFKNKLAMIEADAIPALRDVQRRLKEAAEREKRAEEMDGYA